MDTQAIILLSGGLDSAVACAQAVARYDVKLALFFDYGQKACRREESAARAIAQRYRIDFQAVELGWMKAIGGSALQDRQAEIPGFDPGRFDDVAYQVQTARSVWVPNRNGVFINAAACFAEKLGGAVIVTGFNAEEGATFKDNTPDFVEAVNNSLLWSCAARAEVVDALTGMDKAQIVAEGLRLDAPFDLFFSCYHDGELMCGKCESCRRSLRAFTQAGALEQVNQRFASIGV